LVAGGAGLQRLTILAADPDATVVVQADYFTPGDAAPPNPLRLEHSSRQATPGGRAPPSSHLNPLQLYVSTQRGQERRAALLDVHA
jgi:hypothetical protein